jgi:hypothetical protein
MLLAVLPEPHYLDAAPGRKYEAWLSSSFGFYQGKFKKTTKIIFFWLRIPQQDFGTLM